MATLPTVDSLRENSGASSQLVKIEDRAHLRSGGVDDGAPKGPVPGGSGDSVGRNYAAQKDEILGAKYRGVSTSREREDQTSAGFGLGGQTGQ